MSDKNQTASLDELDVQRYFRGMSRLRYSALGLLITLVLAAHSARAATEYSVEDFVAAVDARGVTTIPEALALLPADIRSNFTLVHSGHGLRETTFAKPAAILASPSGKFLLTFGAPGMRFSENLELAQWNARTRSLELFQMPFPPVRENGRVVRPAANPAQCLTCHGDSPRFLWGHTPKWRGIYGGEDDLLTAEERAEYAEFRREVAGTAPYRALIFGASPMAPFRNDSPDPSYALRPNARMTDVGARLNAESLAERIVTAPAFELYKHDLLRGLARCAKAPDAYRTLDRIGIDEVTLQFLPMGPEPFSEDGLDYDEGTPGFKFRDLLLGALVPRAFPSLEADGLFRRASRGRTFGEWTNRYFTQLETSWATFGIVDPRVCNLEKF